MDYTIVTVALPSIVGELGVTIGVVQWVVTAYGLTLAGFLLVSGRAGDIYGHKRLFIAGLVVFSLSSLASGFAPSIWVLILARGVQGIGAAIGTATGLSILLATFSEGAQRNRALGIFAALLGSAFVIGEVSGGLITTYLGWRWVFEAIVPIGLATAAASAKVIRMPLVISRKANLDLPGAITVTTGAMLVVYALTEIQTGGAVSLQIIETIALSILVFAGFAGIESRVSNPLLPLGFLGRGTVLTANLVAFLTISAFGGEIFLVTVYLQQVLGFTPLQAGLAFAPSGLAFFATSGFLSAKLVNRSGVRAALIIGEGLTLGSYLLLTQVSVAGDYLTVVLPATIINSLGMGLAFPAFNIAAVVGAKRGEEGLASGVINMFRFLGVPFGVAFLVTVATSFDPPDARGQLLAGMVNGLGLAFLAAALLTVAAALLSYLIKPSLPFESATRTVESKS